MSATETITNAQGLISSAEASEELLSKSTSSGRAALSNKLTHIDELVKVPQLDMDLPQAVPNLREQLADLFAENILAKVWRVACESLPCAEETTEEHTMKFPHAFPEYVPQDPKNGEKAGQCYPREASFWKCGFFPGTLYELLERAVRYPQLAMHMLHSSPHKRRDQLRAICEKWSEPLHDIASRTDTHDTGFIVMPSLRKD